MERQYNYLVSVLVLVYNQEKYIEQTINSILTQKTNFNFEIIVGDDCSTDRTIEILDHYAKAYPKFIKIYKSNLNQGLVKNYVRTLKLCEGKYIAQCAGDDYWTDSYKLQRQFDFLELHPDYGMIHSDVDTLSQNTGKIIPRYNHVNNWEIPSGDIYEQLLIGIFIKSVTVLMRLELVIKYLAEENPYQWSLEDHPLFLYLAKHSKIFYEDRSVAMYRITKNSVSRRRTDNYRSDFLRGSFEVGLYFANKYGSKHETMKEILKHVNRKKIEIGYYEHNKYISKEGYIFLKNNNALNFKYLILYAASKYKVIKCLTELIFRLKNIYRILINYFLYM